MMRDILRCLGCEMVFLEHRRQILSFFKWKWIRFLFYRLLSSLAPLLSLRFVPTTFPQGAQGPLTGMFLDLGCSWFLGLRYSDAPGGFSSCLFLSQVILLSSLHRKRRLGASGLVVGTVHKRAKKYCGTNAAAIPQPMA